MSFGEKHLERGPVHVAPLVDLVEEYALHGWLTRTGALSRGAPVRTVQAGGSWRSAERAFDLPRSIQRRLFDALDRVGARLHSLGYFGPFGIDAFQWEDAAGHRHIHAPSEVNARYTMAYAVGAPELIEADRR